MLIQGRAGEALPEIVSLDTYHPFRYIPSSFRTEILERKISAKDVSQCAQDLVLGLGRWEGDKQGMEKTNRISRQLLLWVFVWFMALGLVLALSGFWEMGFLKSSLHEYLQQTVKGESFEGIEEILKSFGLIYWEVLAGSLLIMGCLFWLSVRSSVLKVVRKVAETAVAPPESRKDETPGIEKATAEEKGEAAADQRQALHLVSLLQREGRLVDFLQEDLQAYDDAQIGAAVRGIQENCQKALAKYLTLEAVIDEEEGDEITIDKGFDASAVKLMGNVAGEPPFKGILQHRGWRVTRFNLPALYGFLNPDIVAPAEVDIG